MISPATTEGSKRGFRSELEPDKTLEAPLFPLSESEPTAGKSTGGRSARDSVQPCHLKDDGNVLLGEPGEMSDSRPDTAYLECRSNPHCAPRRIVLDASPFRLGRSETSHCVLPLREVSREHAEIMRSRDGAWCLRDLGSTNGCFVNGQRIRESQLTHDDIIHIACVEFRFVDCNQKSAEEDAAPATHILTSAVNPRSLIRGEQHLQEMLLQRCVSILYQPIVNLRSGAVLGYEALARSTHKHLCEGPQQFLAMAEECGIASRLSRMLRHEAEIIANGLPRGLQLFLNVHSSEIREPGLLADMCRPAHHGLVFEIHEDAVTDVATLRALQERARSLGIKLAFDDFGAGQARLLELADAPPDYVKLDMKLVRNIDLIPSRHALVRGLVKASRQLGVRIIAEGIETQAEATVCQRLGCDFGQGFLFGHPHSIDAWLTEDNTSRPVYSAHPTMAS
ncbi:MAG: EAL domain-containing protein [Planctomycetes bacterium]|nr:EAL domain-containing protein [Planctomycetota bacterium]